MSEQEAIAARVETANAAVIESVRETPTIGWRHPVSEGDRRTAATLAHHIGAGYDNALDWGLSIRSARRMVDITPESIAAQNAEHALRFPLPDPQEVIDYLAASCDELATLIRSIADLELDQPSTNVVMGENWTLRDVFEATVRHTERHHAQFVAVVESAEAEAKAKSG
jgi:DinB superfamily